MTTRILFRRGFQAMATVLVVVLAQGCASNPSPSPNANPADPWESFNRGVFKFNDGIDRNVLKPVATVYRDVTPSPVRTGVSNFFSNISDGWSLVNNVLQLKPKESAETLLRLGFNTIFGFAGVVDIATSLRLEKHTEDFGQTLGFWGVRSGPYLVLPLLGPSTVRDAAGLVVDVQSDGVSQTKNIPARNSLSALRIVDTRENLLEATGMLDQAALDKYSFTRDIYLQRRRSLIRPDALEAEERFDLPEGTAVTRPGAVGPTPAVK